MQKAHQLLFFSLVKAHQLLTYGITELLKSTIIHRIFADIQIHILRSNDFISQIRHQISVLASIVEGAPLHYCIVIRCV